jgi:hypothetical protein
MEEVLKGLQGKTLTKKKLFDFLADINLEDLLSGKVSNTTQLPEKKVEIKKTEIKCGACSKTFTVENSLKRHYKRNPACVKWIETSDKSKEEKPVELKKGLHRIVNELLEKAICGENNLKCMWCETEFVSTGNLNKHLSTSTVCNRMSYNEFKRLLENL